MTWVSLVKADEDLLLVEILQFSYFCLFKHNIVVSTELPYGKCPSLSHLLEQQIAL